MSRSTKTRSKALAAGMAALAAAGVLTGAGAGSATVALGATASAAAASGTPVIDGVQDAAWSRSPVIQLPASDSPVTADARLMWDQHYLYALVEVADSTPFATVSSTGQPGNAGIGNDDDSVDFWINWQNSPFASYYNTTGALATHYDVTRSGIAATNYPPPFGSAELGKVKTAVVSDSSHYVVEAAFPWPGSAGPQPKISLNISVNDDSNGDGKRDSLIAWQAGPAGSSEIYDQSAFGLPPVTMLGTQPSGFTSQYVTAPAAGPGDRVRLSAATWWRGPKPAFTKLWGDSWLSVSSAGEVTGTVPAGAPKSGAITVRGSNQSVITVTVPVTRAG